MSWFVYRMQNGDYVITSDKSRNDDLVYSTESYSDVVDFVERLSDLRHFL